MVVYLQDVWIDINRLINDDVWVLALVHPHESGGYKLTIRARTSLIPIREKSRDIEYEQIVTDDDHLKQNNTLDFINTLWNNCKFLPVILSLFFFFFTNLPMVFTSILL